MDQLELPSAEIWEVRRQWFEEAFDVDRRGGGYIIGEHATGLLVDLQSVYCAGAFITCIILGCAIVDSHLRETELEEKFSGGMKSAFKTSRFEQDLEWLRLRRNRLIHFSGGNAPEISVDMHYANRDEHENEARRAIQIVASVLFENPWV